MKRLSLIIVTYNSERDIYDCLASVWEHCDIPREELEVIIVDNSKDCEPMFAKLKQLYGEDIVLIHNTHNGGYGQGNNVGIRAATSPLILIMNPDVRLYEPIFKTAVEAFSGDSRLSILGMKQMRSPQRPSTNSFNCTYMMNGYLFTFLTSICNHFDWYIPHLMHFSGSCFFVSKDKFEGIGLFDESNFMYGEEDDIHYRMKKAYGCHMKYVPRLHYIHLFKEKVPSLDYWKRVVDVAATLNEKKGYSRKKTVLNRWRNNRLLLLRERIKVAFGRKPSDSYPVLQDYQQYLRSLLMELNRKQQ